MLCCLGENQLDGDTHMPSCHNDIESDAQADIENQDFEQSCDCDMCFQKNIAQASVLYPLILKDDFIATYMKTLISTEPAPLYLPPKQYS